MNISKIFNLNQPLVNLAHDVLLARGFLVNLNANNQLYLSNNASLKYEDTPMFTGCSDLVFLDNALKKLSIGSMSSYASRWRDKTQVIHSAAKNELLIDESRLVIQIDSLTPEQINQLFDYNSIVRHEVCWYKEPEWNKFTKHLQGLKIPLSSLESMIALLVKACSAVGIKTLLSCQGHLETKYCYAQITFYDEYSSLLFSKIIDTYSKQHKLRNDWQLKGVNLKIIADNELYDANYYAEILEFAKYIYQNRAYWLMLKQDIINLMQTNYKDHTLSDFIASYKIIYNQANAEQYINIKDIKL